MSNASGNDLLDLATVILRAAGDVRGHGVLSDCLGVRKVFVAAVYDTLGAVAQGWTRGEFAELLAQAQRAGLVSLSRLDLVEGLTHAQRELDRMSRVTRGGAEWQLVRLES